MELRSLVQGMISKDPNDRPDVKEVGTAGENSVLAQRMIFNRFEIAIACSRVDTFTRSGAR